MTIASLQKTFKKLVRKPKVSVADVVLNTQLNVEHYFSCPVFLIERPDFLEAVTTVSEEKLKVKRNEGDLDEIYPVYMSDNFYNDPRVAEFTKFIGSTAWNILVGQGYDMQDMGITFTEMWTQEHHKHSTMDAHVHGFGSQIVGFYFLETPENCSRVVFQDPRAAKVQIDLPEQDISLVTHASKMINHQPKPGLMILTNSWLSHSFSSHAADKPIKFVHFNLTVSPVAKNINNVFPAAEVI